MVPHHSMARGVKGQMQIGPRQHPAGHPAMHGHHMLAYQTSHGGGGGGGGGWSYGSNRGNGVEEGRELGIGQYLRGRGRKGAYGECSMNERCTEREGVARLHRAQQLDGEII